jgi:hypothetical protein
MSSRAIFSAALYLILGIPFASHAYNRDECLDLFSRGLNASEFAVLGQYLDSTVQFAAGRITPEVFNAQKSDVVSHPSAATIQLLGDFMLGSIATNGLSETLAADPSLASGYGSYLSAFQHYLEARGNSLIPLLRGHRSAEFNAAATNSWNSRKDLFAKITTSPSLSIFEKKALKLIVLRTENRWLALKGEELARAHNRYNRINRIYGSTDIGALLISFSVIALATAPAWAFSFGETFLIENLLILPMTYFGLDGVLVPFIGMGASYLLGQNPLSVGGSPEGVTGWNSISFFPMARFILGKVGEIIWGKAVETHEDLNEALKTIPKNQIELFCSYRAEATAIPIPLRVQAERKRH